MTEQGEVLKYGVDVVSISTLLASIEGHLPAIAALITVIWSCIRIYETKTFQLWVKRKREP